MEEFLRRLRERLTSLLDERSAVDSQAQAVFTTVEAEQRSELTAEEAEHLAAFRADLVRIDGEVDATEQRIGEIEQSIAARRRADERVAQLRAGGSAQPGSTGTAVLDRPAAVSVTGEPAVYNRNNAQDVSFFRDVALRNQDFEAQDRLRRHLQGNQLEARDGTTANYAGLVVPQYFTDLAAPLLRAARPFADVVRHADLPPTGMTMNVSRITTGATVGLQASENAALSEQDIDDTLLAVSVRTLGGIQDVSRQAIERGVGIDQIVIQDLAAAYATAVDAHILAHATDGVLNQAGINAITYTDATPTVPELWPKLADAVSQVNTARYLPATLIVMHPRRWAWMMAALDSTSRPFIVPNSEVAYNPMGIGNVPGAQQVMGTIMGLPVLVDPNVPTNLGAGTNQDAILVVRTDDLILWEEPGSPMRVRVDEPGAHTLTIRFVLWGYLAFTAGRYATAVSAINGTGLITPTL